MRYLVISDIHSNLEAFGAVLAAAGEFDATLFLGDLVGYGPNPNECADLLLRQPNITSVIGNHDIAALGGMDLETFNPAAKLAAEWTQKELSSGSRTYLELLGEVEEWEGFTAVHGSPADPVWEYLENRSQGPESFARFTTPVCFNGHTHVPRVFTQEAETKVVDVFRPETDSQVATRDDTRRIINPGSIGQPRDGDPRAAFGLLDSDSGMFTLRRTEYDIGATQAKMIEVGLPEQLASRLSYGM